ncbi:MAG: SDR family NAD(P)-dependent oxidoreductase [Deltaproteobacteria bacterium]|nr:SDR family NAD(P)-dependent oxidoreductase [Deltaproteobacteria bacterium]
MYSLEGHSAIITGGASGIGLATVRLLAEAGANVVIADINEEAGARMVEELTGKGVGALFVRTDVTQGDDVDALIRATTARFGSLQIVMPFAGIGLEKLALETTREEWDRMIAINLTGSFLVMQAAGTVMAEAGYGRIVAMASVSGMRGGTGRTAYGATKGAMITMTRVMALELAETGVTVNALAPGPVDTALTRKMYDDETRRAYDRAIPMRRFAMPEEVAHAALFLALPQSGYITGITLPVDGGFSSSGVIKRS